MAKSLTAPLERIRIIRQATDRGSNSSSSLLRDIYKQEGFRGLWRGNAVNLSRVVPSYAVRFSVFGRLSDYKETIPAFSNPFVVGALSGLASSLASYPLEVLRTRISVSGSLLHAFRRGSLFAGCSLTVIETMPYAALSLGTYNYLTKKWFDGGQSGLANFAAGLISGAVSTSVCFPIDTLRRNKMMTPALSAGEIFSNLISQNGIPRLYRGLTIALTKSVPTVAITLTVNQYLLDNVFT